MLRLLHPFMPFVTEELWQRLMSISSAEHPRSISLAAYPKPANVAPEETSFGRLQRIVTAARELRADHKLDPKAAIAATLYLREALFSEADVAAIAALTRLTLEQRSGSLAQQAGLIRSTPEYDLIIHVVAAAQNGTSAQSRARIMKEIARLERAIESQTRQLNDQTFIERAPEHVVATLRSKLAEYQEQLKKNRELLDNVD
jgi:valyl-tRNA synthetase